eukprot:jgi/Ulvmu1/12245/UM086_0036.1
MIIVWLLCAALWLPSAAAVPATAQASNEEELRSVVKAGTPHITITADLATSGGLVISHKEILSLRGTCHLDKPGADPCKLRLGDTIQIGNDLWLDGLDIVPPMSGSPALRVPKIYTQLWMTNVSMNGNGTPTASGIELNGHLFAENCTFSKLKALTPGRGAAVHLSAPRATATLHRCALAGNNLLDAQPGSAAVYVNPGAGLILSQSAFSDCVAASADAPPAAAAVARNALLPCVATTTTTMSTGPVSPAKIYSKPPMEYAVYGDDGQVQLWLKAPKNWTPAAGEEGWFLRGNEGRYESVRQAAGQASALERQEQAQAEAEGTPEVDLLSAAPPRPGESSRAAPSGTLVAALVGSVVVLVVLAGATVVALLLLQRHRKRANGGCVRAGGLRGLDGDGAPGQANDGDDNSGGMIQAPYGVAPPAARGHGQAMADKAAALAPGALTAPPNGRAYSATMAQHTSFGGPAPAALGARTGPLFVTPQPGAIAAGATAPVGSASGHLAAAPHALPPPSVNGSRPVAVLTAANLSLLEQSIPAAAQTNPFSHPPAIRSKLTVEQGLQDALDSLIISGRPLMGRYTLDASSVREITPKSIVQFASEVPEAARPVAVKFFVSRPNFEREEAALGTDALQGGFDRDVLRIESNYDGSLRAPNGYIYPPCIVMPRGESLPTWVATRDPKLLEVAQMLMHVGRRLAAVHRAGWAHRSLHPGNVLQRLGEPGNWMITDWSCAAKNGTFPPLVDGLRYCPPEDVSAVEQGQVATKATAAADVWALGIIAFETLTKTTVFPGGTTEKQIRDRVTGRLPLPWEDGDSASRELVRALRGFRRSVMLCLERNPARRPRSTEVVNMWQALFDGPTATTINTDHDPSDRLPTAVESTPTATVTAETPVDSPANPPAPPVDVHISAMPSL